LKYLLRQLQDIRQGGVRILVNKLKFSFIRTVKHIILLLNAIWAIPAVWCMRKLRHLFLIRVGTLRSERIGHFSADGGQQWVELAVQPMNQIDLYWLPKQTSNFQWEIMIRRNFKVAWPVYYLDRWNAIMPGGEAHHRTTSDTRSRDIRGLLDRTTTKLEFLSEEEVIAKDWLQGFGWQADEPFVCLLVRDSAYLEKDPTLRKNRTGWSYHSYRDSDIDTYVSAMEWLADQGVWVIRMGKQMVNPLQTKHKKIIDYAFNDEKSDLLDIWLFANCNLCISTGTGPDMVSNVYRRPLLMLNFMPLKGLWTWNDTTTFPKNLIWEDSGSELSFQDHLIHSYPRTQDYQRAGIRIESMTSEEIMDALQERWSQLEGNWEPQAGDHERQTEFWRQLKSSPEFSKNHGFIHSKARLGDSYLRKNLQFLKT
jgi:putative glycosyltransferase (TIGR04372 family)